jgi:hypothetical protein
MTPNRRLGLTATLAAAVLALAQPGVAPAAPPPLADDFRFLPADADLLFAVHMDKLLASPPVQKLRKDIPEFDKGLDGFRKEYGVAAADVERFAGAGRVKAGGLFVLRTKKAVKAADVLAAIKEPRFEGDKGTAYKETKVGKFTVFEPDKGWKMAVCVVDEHTLVAGEMKDVKPALERADKGGKGDVPAGLKKGRDRLGMGATAYFVADIQGVIKDDPKALPPELPGGVKPAEVLKDTEAVAGSLTIEADVNFRLVGLAKDAKAAAALKAESEKALANIAKMFKEQPGVPKEIVAITDDLPTKVKVATEGNAVVGTLSIKSDVAVEAFKAILVPKPVKPEPIKDKPPKTDK